MSFFRFKENDIIQTSIVAHPSYDVELNGDQVTGSIFLEKPFLNDDLQTRQFRGFSLKEGVVLEKNAPFTASIDIIDVEKDSTLQSSVKSNLSKYQNVSGG